MKYFFDTEFFEHGETLELISIGIVAEDAREFYAVNMSVDADRSVPGWHLPYPEWLEKNVLNRLEPKNPPSVYNGWHTVLKIREDLLEFIKDDPDPEFWAYYGAYDWVVLCQIMGGMLRLPKNWPWVYRDLRVELDRLGHQNVKDNGRKDEHNALADARWVKYAHDVWLGKEHSDE